jgi:DNA-binding MarR family transcriptional regulator
VNRREAFAAGFRALHPKFSRLHTQLLGRVDLTLPQYSLLCQLMLLGTVSMSEISSRLEITKPAVTNLVDRLEKKKFLRRAPDAQDRRVIHLEILPKGEKVIAEIQEQSLAVLLKAYDQFNTAENETIGRFYATLSKVLDDFSAKARHAR